MSKHISLGKTGEKLACRYLSKNGYLILETNWRYGRKEIDIIAKENNILIIAEVKTRSYEFTQNTEEIVNSRKQKYLI